VCRPCCRYFGAWRPGELNHSFMCAPIQPRGLSFHQLSFLTARRKGCGLCLELGGPLGNTPFQRSRLLESTARHCDLQVPAGPITPVRGPGSDLLEPEFHAGSSGKGRLSLAGLAFHSE
jgi:hypothetical protein